MPVIHQIFALAEALNLEIFEIGEEGFSMRIVWGIAKGISNGTVKSKDVAAERQFGKRRGSRERRDPRCWEVRFG